MNKKNKKQNLSIKNKYSIGQQIKTYREKNNLTGEQLAELLDITPNYLNKIENGNSAPSLSLIIKCSNTLAISVDTLLDDNLIYKNYLGDRYNNFFIDNISKLDVSDRKLIIEIIKLYLKKDQCDG